MSVSGLDQRDRLLELNDRRARGRSSPARRPPAQRCEKSGSRRAARRSRLRHQRDQRRQRTDPDGDAEAVEKHRRPGQSHSRRCRCGVPGHGQRQADADQRDDRQSARAPMRCAAPSTRTASQRSQPAARASAGRRTRLSRAPPSREPLAAAREDPGPNTPREPAALGDADGERHAMERSCPSSTTQPSAQRTRRRRRRTARDRDRPAPARSARSTRDRHWREVASPSACRSRRSPIPRRDGHPARSRDS